MNDNVNYPTFYNICRNMEKFKDWTNEHIKYAYKLYKNYDKNKFTPKQILEFRNYLIKIGEL